MKITLPDVSQCIVTLSYAELFATYNVFLFKRERGERFSETQGEVFTALQALFEPSRRKENNEKEKSADKSDSPIP